MEAGNRLIEEARRHGWIDAELLSVPQLAEDEKALFIAMMRRLPEYLREEGRAELTLDEIVSLFNFVYAKAAEAVTLWYTDQRFEPTLEGLFDGAAAVYADENLLEAFRDLPLPEVFARTFLETPVAADPLLALFEALKIAWRVSCHIGLEFLEDAGLVDW